MTIGLRFGFGLSVDLRPSVLGQDRSETKNLSWSWTCRCGVVLWKTILSRLSS